VKGAANSGHKKKPTHGGKRKGAGPKFKYGEPTEKIGFRVPKSHIAKITEMVTAYLEKLKIK
jgi:hypothetical protein